MKPTFTIGSFGIICDENHRILLVHRTDIDFWNLPGGGVEQGEAPWEACVREVKEETGLDVEISRMIGTYSKPDKNEIVFSFECKIISGKITLNEEARDIRYFDIDKIPTNTIKKQVERIKDYAKNSNDLIMTIQNSN